MESPGSSILFFGEGAQDTKAPLDRILHSRRDDTLLASFLRKVSAILVEEVHKLPASDREGLPNFRDLNNFSVFVNGGLGHPALLPTEIVLVQLAHFIESVTSLRQVQSRANDITAATSNVHGGITRMHTITSSSASASASSQHSLSA